MKMLALLASCLLTFSPWATAANSKSLARQTGGDEFYVVVSMTPNGPDTYDVKLKNPRTGYVHSVTVFVDVIVRLAVGDWVSKRREGGRITLIPRGGSARPPRPDPPPPPRPRPDPWGLPPAYADDTPPKHTDKNTMRPGSDAARRPPIRFPTLNPQNYQLYPIDSIQVINADRRLKDADKPLSTHQPKAGVCDVVANGSFTFQNPQGTQMFPAVPVMRNGRLDNAGLPKTWRRGGLAVLRDGTIIVGQQPGPAKDTPAALRSREVERAIRDEFGEGGNPVKSFMGGGALIIKDGSAVSSGDLYAQQEFDNGGHGLSAEQFRRSQHTLVGIIAGQAFLIIARDRGGAGMQSELLRAGFGSVVMFDGGAGFYWHDLNGNRDVAGTNILGLCVRTRR